MPRVVLGPIGGCIAFIVTVSQVLSGTTVVVQRDECVVGTDRPLYLDSNEGAMHFQYEPPSSSVAVSSEVMKAHEVDGVGVGVATVRAETSLAVVRRAALVQTSDSHRGSLLGWRCWSFG